MYAIGRNGEEDFPPDECIQCESDNAWYYMPDAHRNGVYMCQASGEWYKEDDLVSIRNELYFKDLVVELDVPFDGEECELEKFTTVTYDGRVIHLDAAIEVEWKDGSVYLLHKDDDKEALEEAEKSENITMRRKQSGKARLTNQGERK